ncbi:hypothetical protein M419DRAFT_69919 [Trichoderma reesei RUT C-30]|uniref:Uncharacterized protein n=1 Tax=Hypocrea jecorina (strain ATCC 56765 / BCRC 32924 / NRRL 11460 / Rut C-30) TaxID=1344414 RepID=A0A024SN94_HYPJR|nr:hypothetical protein M419DRAFT_69919 [Trichoderma reesei RUT C-30]
MDKVTLLTSSRLEPTAGFRPHSSIIVALGSLLTVAALPLALEYQARLARLCSSISLRYYSFFISRALLLASSCAGKHLLSHALFASQSFLTHASAMFSKTVVDFWQSRRIQKIRAKLFYEFAVFILGCGNAFFLLVFWPGWIFLGAAVLALRQLAG